MPVNSSSTRAEVLESNLAPSNYGTNPTKNPALKDIKHYIVILDSSTFLEDSHYTMLWQFRSGVRVAQSRISFHIRLLLDKITSRRKWLYFDVTVAGDVLAAVRKALFSNLKDGRRKT